MRTASAYLSKIKAEAKGRTFKVQDTNHRAETGILYRAVAACGPLSYTQIVYVPPPKCPCTLPIIRRYDGGTPLAGGSQILDGGTPAGSGAPLDGGNP